MSRLWKMALRLKAEKSLCLDKVPDWDAFYTPVLGRGGGDGVREIDVTSLYKPLPAVVADQQLILRINIQ